LKPIAREHLPAQAHTPAAATLHTAMPLGHDNAHLLGAVTLPPP